MDQLSAHLERGWDLAQRGDTQGASSSARRALELNPNSPEVHNLIGFVAALDGDCDEAIEAYQQAICLDDSYVEAMLNAAELLVHPMGQYDDAIDMCDQVLDLSEYDDEIIDALLLKFEALLAKGETDEARAALARLPAGPFDNGAQNFLAGRAFFELGEREKAAGLIDAALRADPKNAEAHYYRGLICEELGDLRAACGAFLEARQLDLQLGMPPWAPNAETFLMFTEKAMAELPDDLKPFMQGAELYIADLPGPEVVVDGVDPRSMTLVDAVLIGSEDEEVVLAVEPEQVSMRVFIYALNILRTANGLAAVQQTIGEALETELRAALADLNAELEHTAEAFDALEADDDEGELSDDAPKPPGGNGAGARRARARR
jgi:tetratricopeptide (TPR) repeat protein